MQGSSQTLGGGEGSFTEGALSFLRCSVTSASNDFKKAPKPGAKAFQTAHDSSGWDRKARWQRAFNLARSKMDVQGMDESVDKWGAGARDAEGGDRRSASAQPARRGSTLAGVGGGGGGALLGAPGTIAELRTPVALKEHLKRGRGARELGIQLVALEAGNSSDLPFSEQDAAAMVAHFDQRRQMLGAPPSPSRPALTPADRALKAWTNNNNTNNRSPGSDRVGSSTSAASGNSVGSNGSGSTQAQVSPLPGSGGAGSSSTEPLTHSGADGTGRIVAATYGVKGIVPGAGGSGNGGGSGRGSFSGNGGSGGGGGALFQRRFSESGSLCGSSFNGLDGTSLLTFRRNAAGTTAPDSIIAQLQQQQPPQRGESASLHRPAQDTSASPSSLERQDLAAGEVSDAAAAAAAAPQPARAGSIPQQSPGGPPTAAVAAPAAATGGQKEHPAGWVPVPSMSGCVDAGSGGGSDALRSMPRPSSADRGVAQLQPTGWSAEQSIGGDDDTDGAANSIAAAGDGPLPPALSTTAAIAAPQATAPASAPQQTPLVLQPLLVTVLSAGEPSSPLPGRPRSARGGLTPGSQPSASAAPAAGVSDGNGSEAETCVRCRLLSPSADDGIPQSPGLHLAATSPVGAAAGGSSSCSGLVPVPPSSSPDCPGMLIGGRRPRPRVCVTSDGTASAPLPQLTQTGWVPADGWSGVGGAAASAAPPPPSRLVMHTSPLSPPPLSPTRAVGGPTAAYRRNRTSSPGLTNPRGPPSGALLPTQSSSSSPPLTLRPHAPSVQPSTPTTPPPPSPSNQRRVSISTPIVTSSHGGGSGSGGAARAAAAATTAVAASPSLCRSPPQGHPGHLQKHHHQKATSAVPVQQYVFKPGTASVTGVRGRLTDDGGGVLVMGPVGVATVSGVYASAAATAAAKPRTTPVSDAVLAGLREVATEVADELSREAEVAAMTRQAIASQRSRLRSSDSGKPTRYISLPGDPWRKWG